MSRKDARDVAFKLVFEYTFNHEQKADMIDEYVLEANLDEDDKSYIKEVYFGITSHYDEIIEKISGATLNFAVDRVYKVDLALMILAIYEITYMESIPYKVSVNEALNLAEKYSTEKSVKYINGVLSKFAR
jgi:N utilization substance protein B